MGTLGAGCSFCHAAPAQRPHRGVGGRNEGVLQLTRGLIIHSRSAGKGHEVGGLQAALLEALPVKTRKGQWVSKF